MSNIGVARLRQKKKKAAKQAGPRPSSPVGSGDECSEGRTDTTGRCALVDMETMHTSHVDAKTHQ